MLELVIKGKNLKELHSEVIKVSEEIKTKYPVNNIPSVADLGEDASDNVDAAAIADWKEMTGQPGAYHNPDLNGQVIQGQFVPPKQATGLGELDSDGVPWDARIHSAEKSKNKSGTWRIRRNLDKDYIVQVTKELMQRQDDSMSGAQAVIPPVNSPAPQQTVVPPIQQPQTAPVQQQVMQPVQQPQTQQPAYPPMSIPQGTKPAHNATTFKQNFAMVIQSLLAEKKITPDYISQLKAHYGVGDLWEIANDDAKCNSLFDTLAQYGLITKVG
jgi:hypothetical protein